MPNRQPDNLDLELLVNPDLNLLQPYPFERLRALFASTPLSLEGAKLPFISLAIGEPKHPTPTLIHQALTAHLDGLASYPTTIGSNALRESMAAWLMRRYDLPAIDPLTQVLPVNGSREALFAIAQTVVDRNQPQTLVVCPNPFYQIYEGAALIAGATPIYVNCDPARNFAIDYATISAATWQNVQLVYVCSPGNPTGAVMGLEDWQALFSLSDRYGFTIVSDECYSEIYFRDTPPLGSLEAAHRLGRTDFKRLIAMTSLSKRSNVPGMRSGFAAGDAVLLKKFLLYRTYHGCAMSPTIQNASIAAWNDETHVQENREQYRRKFAEVTPVLQSVLDVQLPDAAFYLWAKVDTRTGLSSEEFSRRLHSEYNVAVLPGNYLARSASEASQRSASLLPDQARDSNPGEGYVRIALVAETAECLEAAHRIVAFTRSLQRSPST